ncbi:hypothetical protein CXB51_014775 [Gossypium anomalum]|uniref:Uncharacterized protein n=1 Tax=Gossypium anomalum TaxID=47600 RepID=A0A8J6D554_9ROSI|nr:hypothetical protein CXB51_014775 [Gossypium anomalum]
MEPSLHIATSSFLTCFRRVYLGCLGSELCFKREFFLESPIGTIVSSRMLSEDIKKKAIKVPWNRLLCIGRMVDLWDQELCWAVTHLKGKSRILYLLKLAWNAYVHSIWCERNGKLFGRPATSVDHLLARIQEIA